MCLSFNVENQKNVLMEPTVTETEITEVFYQRVPYQSKYAEAVIHLNT